MDKNTALDKIATNELEASLRIENPAKMPHGTELAPTPRTHRLDLDRDAGQERLHAIEAYLNQSQTELIYGLADHTGLRNKDHESCQRLEQLIEQYYQIYPGPREHRS